MSSRKYPLPEKPPDDYSHPSQDSTDRFAVDQLLRSLGYSIHTRKADREPLWERRGHAFPENDILCHLDPNEVANAEHREFLYFCGECP